jgi:orotate phosphoribosyltransferase
MPAQKNNKPPCNFCPIYYRFAFQMSTATTFAEKLLQIKALKVNLSEPFTWASGWKSPVYCDNRKLLSFPHVRDYVKSELANTIMDAFPDADSIAGVATAGIPHGALAADLLKLPFIYVRSKPKGHGLGNQIEGVLEPGQKVVVVEDLVSTGKSSLEAVQALREAGADVIGMCALFTYGFPQADEAFAAANVRLITLSNYNALMEVSKGLQIVAESDMQLLQQWRLDPANWTGR